MPAKSKARAIAFISYSHDDASHESWVESFAKRLELSDIRVVLDHWSLALGDSMTHFMESAVRTSDFVLMICTPEYKRRSDIREFGTGYEAEILATKRLVEGTSRFIPVLRSGDWLQSLPEWAGGIFGVDLRAEPIEDATFAVLLKHLKTAARKSAGSRASGHNRRKPRTKPDRK
ncbi:MAG: toll/interleukin-1 receptor domain-containing protein [Candidatus Binataceae bacterium]